MAGGSPNPNVRNNYPSSVAGGGSGSQGLNGVDENGNPRIPTMQQLGIPGAANPAYYTPGQYQQMAGDAMPAVMQGVHSDVDPVGYLAKFGLTLTHPDMATYIDGDQARKLVHAQVMERGRSASNGSQRTAFTTVHATNEQRRREHSRVSATFSPFEHEGGYLRTDGQRVLYPR